MTRNTTSVEPPKITCPSCDGQGGTDGYDQRGEPTHYKVTCELCDGEGEIDPAKSEARQ
jgi:DnaJ-class molecular chaperone